MSRLTRGPAAAVVMVLLVAPLPGGARADEPIGSQAQRRIAECIGASNRIRLTGSFGCLETRSAVVNSNGVWCEHTEPCEFTADAGPQQFYWEEIDRIETGQTHGRQAAGIAYFAVLAGATIVILTTSHTQGLATIILPLAAVLVALPLAIGSELTAGLIGSQTVTWEVCYQRAPPGR